MGLHEECTVVWTWCPAGPTPCGSSLARGFRWNLRGPATRMPVRITYRDRGALRHANFDRSTAICPS
jgi:hypothetical protein